MAPNPRVWVRGRSTDRIDVGVKLLFENAELLDPEQPEPVPSGLLVDDGRIVDRLAPGQAPGDARRIDLRGCALAPGFVDLHFHGELIFASPRALPQAFLRTREALVREGTTAFLATSVAWPHQALGSFVRQLAELTEAAEGSGARAIGIHLEGPWINPVAAGAQPPGAIRAYRPEELADLLARAEGLIRLVTLAPEVEGRDALLSALAHANVVAALGHSLAGPAEVDAAVSAGLRHVTHLFNAMGSTRHREPTEGDAYGEDELAGRLLHDDRVSCDLICDGVHVHPSVVAMAARAKRERLMLITDRVQLPETGADPQQTAFGATGIVDDGTALRLADGRLAGSSLSLDRALRNAIAFGALGRLEAIVALTLAPARLLGMENEHGTLRPGARADLVVLDADNQVQETWIDGRQCYRAPKAPTAV